MTTLTLTPDPVAGTVTLVADGVTGEFSLVRVDANGSAPVRLRVGQGAIAGQLIVVDPEAALVGLVRYDLTDDTGTVSGTTVLDAPGPRIADIQLPGDTAPVDYVHGYRATAGTDTVVHWPVGRRDPVVVIRPRRLRAGTLEVHCSDHDAAQRTVDVLGPGRRLLLRQADHPGLDMHFVVTSAATEPVQLLAGSRWLWAVSVDYVETRSPSIPLLGTAGWSWDDLTAAYPSWAALPADYATWADVALGPGPAASS